jgi:quercetin dioxygenase-like cupin family protein
MAASYVYLADLAKEAGIPANGILSRTLYQDDHVKAVIFGFAEGQELSAHTAPFRAFLHILEGSARITLGADVVEGAAGTWVAMEPNLEHGITALSPLRLLLTMMKQDR